MSGVVREAGALTAERIARVQRQFTADRLAAELGCDVTPHPYLGGAFEARDPMPGVWLLMGTPEELRAEAAKYRDRVRERREGMLLWLRFLGSLSRPR
jgi:hypothetical protein